MTSNPQASGQILAAVIPANLEEAASTISVVLCKATDPAKIPDLVQQAPALQVG
jgi:hypothetical protein